MEIHQRKPVVDTRLEVKWKLDLRKWFEQRRLHELNAHHDTLRNFLIVRVIVDTEALNFKPRRSVKLSATTSSGICLLGVWSSHGVANLVHKNEASVESRK